MEHATYDRTEAARLLPLLNTIVEEILDRLTAVTILEARLDSTSVGRETAAETLELVAERATQQRELSRSIEELKQLGVSVVGNDPLTLRLRARRSAGAR